MAKTEEKALVKTQAPGALALPDYIKAGDTRGSENITADELKIPRVLLAQALSPQLIEGDGSYIEGLKLGDAFNSVSREIYGKGPFEIIVVRAEPARYIEFYPRNSTEGKGVKDFNVAADDPRTKWQDDQPPRATKFMEFVVLLGESLEPAILSFKCTNKRTREAARDLATYVKLPLKVEGKGQVAVPAFARRYSITTTVVRDGDKTYAVPVISIAGLTGGAAYAAADSFYESIKKKVVAAPDEAAAGAAATDDEVPF